jgi:hypothetical protein
MAVAVATTDLVDDGADARVLVQNGLRHQVLVGQDLRKEREERGWVVWMYIRRVQIQSGSLCQVDHQQRET